MKNFKHLAIIVSVAAVTIYLIFNPKIDKGVNDAGNDSKKPVDESVVSESPETKPSMTNKSSNPKTDSKNDKLTKRNKDSKMPEVTYSLKQVFELSEIYPKEKEKLLRIVKKPNPFLEEKIKVEPHSVQDIRQEEYGAIKVMAMRVILEQEKDQSIILQDLSDIIREAEDPTIVAIAESMKKSVTNNRDFTKDVTDAINNLPIEGDEHNDSDHD